MQSPEGRAVSTAELCLAAIFDLYCQPHGQDGEDVISA